MIGKELTKTRELFEKINEDRIRKRALRSFAFPFLPTNAAKQKLMTDVGRLLALKYEGDTKERARATAVLDRLYEQFGVADEEPKEATATESGGWPGGSSGGRATARKKIRRRTVENGWP